MAVGTHGGFLRTLGHGAAVHTLFIRSEWLGALAYRFHDELLAVTGATGGCDVGMIHARLGIGGGQQLVRAAVAIDAGGGVFGAFVSGLGVKTLVVSGLLLS